MRKPLIHIGTLCIAMLCMSSANALLIRVSQESSAGAGDFDANVLGNINTYDTGMTASNYYQYGSPDAASYNGDQNGGPAPIADGSMSFLSVTADGLVFYTVHDEPGDGDGGTANMAWNLTGGDTAAFLVGDDGAEGLNPGLGVQATSFTAAHRWLDCCTDGFGLGSIDGDNWALIGSFTGLGNLDGGRLNFWTAMNALGGSIGLDMDLNRRVRFDLADVPEPSVVALFVFGILGLTLARRRAR